MLSVHTSPLAMLGGKETGGMNVYVRELARALGHRSMTVDIFTRAMDPDQPETVQFGPRARIIHVPAGDVATMPKEAVFAHLPEFVRGVRSYAERHDLHYRLVHSHYWLSAWCGAALSERWEVPHVVMYHTLGLLKNNARRAENESWQRIAVERRTMQSADRIVVASDDERRQIGLLYDAPQDRISTIPCGVDLDSFNPLQKDAARARLGLEGKRIITFVGRMQPLKGADLLLEAMASLNGRHNYQILLIGGALEGDGEVERLRVMASSLGIAERVSFLGAQPQEKLPLYYSAADACVVPSHYESFGLVAMEALACGTPVIASRVGGLPSIIRDEENGLLVGWRTADLFANSIDRLLSDDVLRQRLSRQARPSVQHLTWLAVADRVLAMYDNMATIRPLAQVCLCSR
jgi:D-inositol-3-phosphate glycosyltransferase